LNDTLHSCRNDSEQKNIWQNEIPWLIYFLFYHRNITLIQSVILINVTLLSVILLIDLMPIVVMLIDVTLIVLMISVNILSVSFFIVVIDIVLDNGIFLIVVHPSVAAPFTSLSTNNAHILIKSCL